MADKKYTKLPVVNQTTTIKNFFDTTVEQLFSKSNIESISAYAGSKDFEVFSADDTYLLEPTADRDKYSLEPVVNNINQLSGRSENNMFYEDFLNVLKSSGADSQNQNTLFDTNFYSFLPPINIDKFINYQEYFWSPTGPTPKIISGTATNPINIDKDIIGKKSFTAPDGTEFKNGMIVSFSGDHVIPNTYKDDKRWIIEGVGDSIIIFNRDQNFATTFSTEDYILYDRTIIDTATDTLINTSSDENDERFKSGGLVGVANYVDVDGFSYTNMNQVDATTGNPMWDGYITPVGLQLQYVVGGIGAYDTEPYDSDNTQENPDYIIMQRGAKDNNVWSRINFWYHRQNFLDAGDQLPKKEKRAVRPILEFDRDIELYNFGTKGVDAVEIASFDNLKSEVVGRPNGGVIDGVTLEVGNRIMFPNEETSIAQKIYTIGSNGASPSLVTLTEESYTASIGDVISIKFGARKQGVEYYWNGTKWLEGQKKDKVNTPILFTAYDYNGVKLDDVATYPNSDFKGTEIFSYAPNTDDKATNDDILGFPIKYANFNNFSEICFDNDLECDLYSYIAFGGTEKTYIDGYIFYKKTLPNGNVIKETSWKAQDKKTNQKVEDRYIVNDSDIANNRTIWEITAKPEVDESSILVFVNGKRNTSFSYNDTFTAITFATFTFSKDDVIDIKTKTTTGYILDANRRGRYNIPLSWHSNLDNVDIKTVAQPQYLEHFYRLIKDQDGLTGEPLGTNNFTDLNADISKANKIVQTDDDLQMAAWLLSNDKFNIRDAIEFNSNEYVKYKNRLKKEIKRYVDNNDTSGMSYGEILELVLESVISFNQGKNVFDYTYMAAFGDQYNEQAVVVNNVLQKAYTLSKYCDLSKLENSLYVYELGSDGIEKLLVAEKDYTITSTSTSNTVNFTDSFTMTLGNTFKFRIYDSNRESTQTPPTPSAMGLYPATQPEIITDATFKDPIKVIVGHDGSKTVAANDIHDFILLEFENRIWNGILADYRQKDSQYDLNIHSIRPGRFRTDTGLSRTTFYNLLRNNFNQFLNRNDVDFVINEYYDASNYFTWNYNSGTVKPGYWRGIYESCYDTERPHTHPWEMLGFVIKPTWWDDQYITTTYTDYSSANKPLWKDLEEGIIRQGSRENVTNDRYRTKNPYRRIGLKFEIPVDEQGNLIAPANIISTTATTKTIDYVETTTGTATANANSFIKTVDGLSVQEVDSGANINITTNNILNHTTGTFPTTDNTNEIEDKTLLYTITTNTGDNTAGDFANATTTSSTAVGVAVNGALIFNASTGNTHTLSNSFTYSHLFRNDVSRDSAGGFVKSDNIYGYAQPGPQTVGLTSWATDSHSPIVGWAFDGLPIYGPYGYTDRLDNTSAIKRIESGYSLKTTLRTTLGGTPNGEFVEDYEYGASTGDLDEFNSRYGVTPEFPSGTRYYVATLDSDLNPAYPFTVGPKYFFTPTSLSTNVTGTATHVSGTENYKLTSALNTTFSVDTSLTNKNWKFGDGAPVENAWKISEAYPFAIAEALLLTKPGKFASVFAEPEKIVRASANTNHILDKTTYKRYKVKNATLHGSVDTNNTMQTSTGWSPFIDSYLRFQGLNPVEEFSKPFKTVNSKLGHKLAGYVDKDTMTVFSDNYSTTGNSSSLILPQEDIQVDVHVGPYATTNDYTGVLVQLTSENKYKVFGYNSTKKYFEIETSDINGPKTQVKVGGEPIDTVPYDVSTQYNEGSIVKSGYNFYRAKTTATAGSNVTNTAIWQRLSSLPMVGGAEATNYLSGTGEIVRVEYGTEYDTVAEVYDFMISLGRHQKVMGYNFGDYDDEIADVNDWAYSAKQFLFWSIGKWAAGNTINLSPFAGKLTFFAPIGKVSAIKDIDQGQFSLLDEEGKKISPTDCEILRDGDKIEVRPPQGRELYGALLYTNEIEHSLLVSNKTIFGDTIFDDVYNQRQARLKLKAKRTAGWNGTLSADGYIIQGEELLPNFDTLASDIGKYNEIGHVPVQKQLYEASRRQYGYQERKYLREFELTQDDQYDFYMGMIRSKGTQNALKILLNSDKVLVPGSVNVYDEWALKLGEFGDVDNQQSLDLKINQSEVKNERQLIQIAYPENTVSKVKEVEVLDRTTKFFQRPFLEIEPPPAEIPGSFSYGGGTTALATVNIGQDGTITTVDVTEPGYGYTTNPAVTVIAAQLLTANISTSYLQPYATSNTYITNTGDLTGVANITITDHHANSSHYPTTIDLSTVASGSATNAQMVANVVSAINTTMANVPLDPTITANIGVTSGNSLITATSQRIANATAENFVITIKGSDFTLAGSGLANLDLEATRYQPRQRFSFESANSTTYSDVTATVNGTATTGNVVGGTNNDWEFDSGSRTTIVNTSLAESGNISFVFAPLSRSDELSNAGNIATENLTIIDGTYPHIDVYIDGTKLEERVTNPLYTVSSISGDTNNSYINFANVQALPGGNIAADAKIVVDERATIDFVDAYQGDLPGASLNIKVEANDALAAKLQQVRTYDITPDDKSDSTILIDVDDSNRLVVRPRDMSEKGLWPTTTKADYTGITDKDYNPLPNAGYVSKYNVDYQAFDIFDFERLFDRAARKASEIPLEDDIVHFARSEHGEFDVYKLSNVSANVSYVKNNEATGSIKLFTDLQLTETALDFNDLANSDASYDHTANFDNVLVLKGNSPLNDEEKALQFIDGEKVYDTTIPDTSSEVVIWGNEQRIFDEAVSIGNVAYNTAALKSITKIRPTLSGNITAIGYDAFSNVSVTANATLAPTTVAIDIYRNVEGDISPYNFNGSPAFKLKKGIIDGVKVGHYLKLHETANTALNNATFQVASVDNNFKEIILYAGSVSLSGIANTIPKANLSFANYGTTSTANSTGTYNVQIYSQKHGYTGDETIKFSDHNLGKAQGTAFTPTNVTVNTFFVEGVASGNTTLDVTSDSVTMGLVSDTVTITTDQLDGITAANLVQGAYVSITDPAGGNMDGNVFQVSNIQTELLPATQTANVSYDEDIIWTDSVAVGVTDKTTIELTSGKTTNLFNGLGFKINGNVAYSPKDVKVTNVEFNKNTVLAGQVTQAVSSSVTVEVDTTSGMEVGMIIDNSGYSAIDGIRTIASIVDNNTITVDSAITVAAGTFFTATKLVDEPRVVKVRLNTAVTLSAGDKIDFVKETQNKQVETLPERSVTSFDIPKGNISADANNISFVVQDATSITTDATITDLVTFQNIKLNQIGKYSEINTVRDYNTGNKTIKIDGVYTGEYSISDTASSTLTDSNELLLTTGNVQLREGMTVTGGNIATKIVTVNGTANVTLASNIAITSGSAVTIKDDLLGNATWVSNQLEITTAEDHGYELDASGNVQTIIGENIRIYNYEPEYYNYTFKVTGVPTANTLYVEGYALDHPYVDSGVEYIGKTDFVAYGNLALQTTPTANVDTQYGNTVVTSPRVTFFVDQHEGNIAINGANVVTNAFPYLNVDEYKDEVERQLISKAGAVTHTGSFQLGLPLFTPIDIWGGKGKPFKNPLTKDVHNAAGSGLSVPLPPKGSVKLPNNTQKNAQNPNLLPNTKANPKVSPKLPPKVQTFYAASNSYTYNGVGTPFTGTIPPGVTKHIHYGGGGLSVTLPGGPNGGMILETGLGTVNKKLPYMPGHPNYVAPSSGTTSGPSGGTTTNNASTQQTNTGSNAGTIVVGSSVGGTGNDNAGTTVTPGYANPGKVVTSDPTGQKKYKGEFAVTPPISFTVPITDILIDQKKRTDCPPAPPAPPPPPPKPDIFYINDFVTYSGKRGQTETKKYTMTSFNGADYTITMLFNMYSAQDRLEVYQSTSPHTRGRLVGSTRNFSILTPQEKSDFAKAGAAHTRAATVGSMGDGFVYYAGKFTWTYNADNGRYITTVLDKHPKKSIAYQYSMNYPVDKDMISSAKGQSVQGPGIPQSGCSQPNPPAVAAPSLGGFNIPNIAVIPNFGNLMAGGLGLGGANWQASILGPQINVSNWAGGIPGAIPTFGGASSIVSNGGMGMGGPGQGLQSVTPSIPKSGTGGQTNPNSSGNVDTGGKLCTQYISVTPLEKLNGKYVPGAPVQVPLCPPKPRVKICGQANGVGKGDTFVINGQSISLSGSTDLKVVKQEIESQAGSEVIVNMSTNTAGETCIDIRSAVRDAMIMRNGCAGGALKQVLDYSIQRDQQNCFTPTKGDVESTTSVQRTVASNGTTPLSPFDGATAGAYSTVKAIPKYKPDATAMDNQRADNRSSLCESKGQNYKVGDRLRVVGGEPTTESETQRTGVLGLRIVSAGSGYEVAGNSVELIVNTTDSTSLPLQYDVSQLGFDDNGGLKGIAIGEDPKDKATYGKQITGPIPGAGIIPMLTRADGSLETGHYMKKHAPTITVKGAGTGAVVVPIMMFGEEDLHVERPAIFEVGEVDDQGGIVKLAIVDRGIYKQFPSDLDQGVPLDYDEGGVAYEVNKVSKVQKSLGDPNINVRGGSRGQGKGARVFLTAKGIPDCSQKGNALNGLGLNEGPVPMLTPDEQMADNFNQWAPYGPDGLPLWTAYIGDDANGNPAFFIDAPNLDGLDFGDELNPGLLDAIGMYPGAYTKDNPLAVDIGDTGEGGPYGNGQGLRFTSPTGDPFNVHMNNNNLKNRMDGALYQYDLADLRGDGAQLLGKDQRNVTALKLDSVRYSTPPANIATLANVWVDNYDANGWAYLESNTVVRHQEKLIDSKFLTDVFTYDDETAEKEFDIDIHDPFKGILPGFIDKEIDFKDDSDPCIYDPLKLEWGSKQVGRRWWNTSTMRYQWYEQGAGTYSTNGYNNQERALCWAELFPSSIIQIYEWTENVVPPELYDGEGFAQPDYITEVRGKDTDGRPMTYYYYWVRGLTDVSDKARNNAGKQRSIADIERLLVDPESQRVPYIGLISPDSAVVNTLGSLIRTEDSVLSVNFKRKDTEASEKHTSWSLAGEGDTDVTIPDGLSIKLIDSLAGYNSLDETVPAKGLSTAERFGSKFRPRQTMFSNLKNARKQMQEALNETFAEIKMDSTFIDWRDNLPSSIPHLITTDWFEVLRTDAVTNKKVYYNDTYKPLRKVTDTKQFQIMKNVLDKSIVQVQKNDSSKYSLYEYSKKTDTFKLIAMEDQTVKFDNSVWLDGQTLTLGQEIRGILLALYQNVFIGTYSEYWNKFFFKMLKHAYAEQGELDWAFKTTYLKIVKRETDLIPFKGFKVDNFDKAITYFNEVKPYSSKIRNYSDIKQAPIENLIGSTTDFDRPPYYDESTKTVRVLEDSVPADVVIRDSDKQYAGFISSNAAIRQANTQIVFDRTKSDMFKNSSGGKTQIITADGSTNGFSFDIAVEDTSRLQVFVNNRLIPQTSTGNSTTVTNYTLDTTNNFLTFENDMSLNPAVGTPENGDKIALKYFDGYDPTLETLNVSIATNIVNIEANSNANIANVRSPDWSAAERIWKFDPDVRSNITTVVDTIYGAGASANANIMQNVSIITSLIENGNLKVATDLVKSKVHATFQGEMIDASTFTDEVPGEHSTYFYTDTRGFDTYSWDNGLYDREVEVNNYLGVFNETTQGNVNFRRDDETIYGFDGVTFSKASYGPDRPEELAVVQPLETLIFDVTTQGNTQISDVSTDTRYIMFADLFGRTEYYRRNVEALTTTTDALNIWENEILVADASKLPEASSIKRAVIWVQGERIEYEVRDTLNNKLSGIYRGTKGTTPNTIINSGAQIYNGEETENIRLRNADGSLIRDPEDYNWIKPVEIYNNQIPLDENWDLSGSLTAYGITYDDLSGGANVRYQGYDASWDGTGSVTTEFADGTVLAHDVDESTGWDSGEQGLKDAISLTDKGTVLQANSSIIDFLQNFD